VEANRLREIISRFPDCRVAVLGDFFLDKYLDVDPALAEISVETGKTANQVVSIRCSPGAAGTVVNNLAALHAGKLHVLGFTGDDGEGFELRRALQNLGCDTQGLLTLRDRFTPIYLKPRTSNTADLSGEHERYDTKNRRPTPADVQETVVSHLERLLPQLDAVIIIDQVDEEECGIVTTRVRESVTGLGERFSGKVFWADSRRRIGRFRNVIIKVNAHEAVKEIFPDGDQNCRGKVGPGRRTGPLHSRSNGRAPSSDVILDDEIVQQAMTELRKRTGRPVFVTAGRRGIWINDVRPLLVRGVRVSEPTDPTGAGDSATAGAVLALCAGANLEEAALLANLAASITVQQLATTGTASPNQLVPRLEMWRSQG
jgi:bifunctional ADP-heptose synthase (sugar kinase/adenylyltransferase)